MISYEDLCQSLDRFNARRRNEQEMANLEEGAPEELAAGDVDMSAAQVAADFAADSTDGEAFPVADQLQEEPEASAEEEAPAPEAEVIAAAGDEEPAGDGFADQAPEDTHEIDVDDVLVEDRLSDDKLPGD